MTIKQFIKSHATEIVADMNRELMNERLFRFWQRTAPHLTLRQLQETYWTDKKSKAEFAVDLGVMFGKVWELYLPFKLHDAGLNVKPLFTSAGDFVEGTTPWENKTGRGKFIQGATHSPKEKSAMNLIQVLWDCRWDVPLNEIMASGEFISEMNICVFDDVVVNSVGEHSDNNSRTQLVFTKEQFDVCATACVVGSIKKNSKNVGFVRASVLKRPVLI